MQYKVEEKGPLTKQIQVTVPAAEVDAAIQFVAMKFRNSVNIPGFRKGKAPLGMVEKQFGRDIAPEATNNLIDSQVRTIVEEIKVEPATGMKYDAGIAEKGKDFVYSFTFDVMPEFKLPDYEGFALEEEEAIVDNSGIDTIIEQARNDFAEPVLVEEKRKPNDGDIAALDFAFYDEEGKEVPGMKAEGTQMPIGQGHAMPEFEDLVKTITSGEEGEGKISFPSEFPNPELAGKTMTVKVKILDVFERKLPEIDDDFAKRIGNFENVQALRDMIHESFMQNKKQQTQGAAKKNLVDSLVKMTDFSLPPSMLERYVNMSVSDTLGALQQQGKSLETLGKSIQELHKDAQKEAEDYVRSYIFLYRVAQAEDVSVDEKDMLDQIRQIATSSRRNFEEVRDEYVKNNMLGALHERIMADKAVQALYDKAKITFVKPMQEIKPKKKPGDKDDDAKEKAVNKPTAKKDEGGEEKPEKIKAEPAKADKSAEKKPKAATKKADK